MKVIISHDVDHLFRDDHYRDLIYPKLWVRETLSLLKRQIKGGEWFKRMVSPFQKKRNYIDELMQFDKEHNIPSTFFFGMEKGLGMSYRIERAVPVIKHVESNGFDTGVHGIDYTDLNNIKKEFQSYEKSVGHPPKGMRMHYVRFNEETFSLLDKVGYKFDSTEFDKKKGFIAKAPYKVGDMWEFPLSMMDTYLPYDLEESKKFTLKVLGELKSKNIEYCTILLHDPHFSGAYSVYLDWYKWFVEMCEEQDMQFTSFSEAVDSFD